MGCCVSTNNKDSKNDKVGSKSLESSKSTHEDRDPPPLLDQEETVKEVLSETPKLKPPPPPPPPPPPTPPPQPAEPIKNPNDNNGAQNHQEIKHTAKNVHFQPPPPPLSPLAPLLDEKIEIREGRHKNEKIFKEEEEEEEIFELEASEVCSLSLSENLSTATVNNGRMDYDDFDDEEVKQRVVMRSPPPKLAPRNRVFSGQSGPKRDRQPPLARKSPTGRTDQSPVRKNNAARSVLQSREQTGRQGLRSDPKRRDAGESSGRRSRSPATNRSTMGRSTSAGMANQSPGRVRTDPSPPGRGGNVLKMVGSNGMAANSPAATTPSESLENPLVSLECFIFL